jgi:hypothetical protein
VEAVNMDKDQIALHLIHGNAPGIDGSNYSSLVALRERAMLHLARRLEIQQKSKKKARK